MMGRKIGYATPPVETQWKKGTSGNPRGRKKGSVNFKTDLMQELSEIIAVTEGGKPKRITKQRALIKALLTKGMKGDVRAANAVIGWSAKVLASELGAPADEPLTSEEQALLDHLQSQTPVSRSPKPTEGEGQ